MGNSSYIFKLIIIGYFCLTKVDCKSQSTFTLTPICNYYQSLSNNTNINIAGKNVLTKGCFSFGSLITYSRSNIKYNIGIMHEEYSTNFQIYNLNSSKRNELFKVYVPYKIYAIPIFFSWDAFNLVKSRKIKFDMQLGINLISLDYSKGFFPVAAQDSMKAISDNGDERKVIYLIENRYLSDGIRPTIYTGLNIYTEIYKGVTLNLNMSTSLGIYTLITRKMNYIYSSPDEPYRNDQIVSTSTGTNFRITAGLSFRLYNIKKRKA